jgi:Nitroreductase
MKCNKLLIFMVPVFFVLSCKEPVKDMKNNTVLENILERKSVRDYTDREISPEIMDNLLKAGMAAPSSRDRRPWQFIVVTDKTLLQTMGERLKTASCLKKANKAIVVCGDINLSDNCWFLDCSAATQNILLAAESMGLGAVWTAVYPYEDRSSIIDDIFKLPDNIKALTVIPLGYPAGKYEPKNKFDAQKIHYDRW